MNIHHVQILSPDEHLAVSIQMQLHENEYSVSWVPITHNRIPLDFLNNKNEVTVMDFSSGEEMLPSVVKLLHNYHHPLTVILIVPDVNSAAQAGLEVGGNIFHVFFGMPPSYILHDFIIKAFRREQYQHAEGY